MSVKYNFFYSILDQRDQSAEKLEKHLTTVNNLKITTTVSSLNRLTIFLFYSDLIQYRIKKL